MAPTPRISANDLKTHGVSIIELALRTSSAAVVQAHGKNKFVVMDLAPGRTVQESPVAHLARLDTIK